MASAVAAVPLSCSAESVGTIEGASLGSMMMVVVLGRTGRIGRWRRIEQCRLLRRDIAEAEARRRCP